jgi:multidrug efflux pump
VTTPEPLPSGGSVPDRVRAPFHGGPQPDGGVREPARDLRQHRGQRSGGGAPTFYFADSDLKFDLPQVEIEIDKDKVASMGLNLSDVARDLGSMLGGGYVNRFVNEGRSYRVIPQVERVRDASTPTSSSTTTSAARTGS